MGGVPVELRAKAAAGGADFEDEAVASGYARFESLRDEAVVPLGRDVVAVVGLDVGLEAELEELGRADRRRGADQLLAAVLDPNVGSMRAAEGHQLVPALHIEQLVGPCRRDRSCKQRKDEEKRKRKGGEPGEEVLQSDSSWPFLVAETKQRLERLSSAT
jgi:hypothetical protein